MKKENTDDLYYIKFHTQKFVYRSWPDQIRHRDIVYEDNKPMINLGSMN